MFAILTGWPFGLQTVGTVLLPGSIGSHSIIEGTLNRKVERRDLQLIRDGSSTLDKPAIDGNGTIC